MQLALGSPRGAMGRLCGFESVCFFRVGVLEPHVVAERRLVLRINLGVLGLGGGASSLRRVDVLVFAPDDADHALEQVLVGLFDLPIPHLLVLIRFGLLRRLDLGPHFLEIRLVSALNVEDFNSLDF